MKLAIECDCGSVKGVVDAKNLKGFRAICLCDDCQAHAHYLKRADVLDENGGTDIIPAMPSHFVFTEGVEKLACIRLSEKGMFRWHTTCCQTPMGNSMNSAAMPYIGVPARIYKKRQTELQITEAFGPVRERMQARFAKGSLPPLAQKNVSVGFMLRVIKFILTAKITRSGSPSPFFTKDGQPLKTPYILKKDERDALRPLCGSLRSDI